MKPLAMVLSLSLAAAGCSGSGGGEEATGRSTDALADDGTTQTVDDGSGGDAGSLDGLLIPRGDFEEAPDQELPGTATWSPDGCPVFTWSLTEETSLMIFAERVVVEADRTVVLAEGPIPMDGSEVVIAGAPEPASERDRAWPHVETCLELTGLNSVVWVL